MGLLKLAKVVYTLTVINSVRQNSVGSTNIYHPRRPILEMPKIWSKSYTEVDAFESVIIASQYDAKDYDKGFIRKNGSDYIISSEVAQVKFACQASYPITWRFPYPEQFSGLSNYNFNVETERSSVFTEKLTEPKNAVFYAFITVIYSGGFQSGYINCQSISNNNLLAQIYVYREEESPIENARETVSVNVTTLRDGNGKQVVLPCRPGNPTLTVSLAKEWVTFQKETKWIPLKLNSSIRFDPKRGFLLSTRLPNVQGKYRCTVDEEEDQMYTFVQVVPGVKSSLEFNLRTRIESELASVSIKWGAIYCCSGKDNPPAKGISMDCRNEAECDLLKPIFMHNYVSGKIPLSLNDLRRTSELDCYKARVDFFYEQSKLLICKSPNIEVMGQYVAAFRKGRDDIRLHDLSNSSQKLGIEEQIEFNLEVGDGYFGVDPSYDHSPHLHRFHPFVNAYDLDYGQGGPMILIPLYRPRDGDVYEGERARVTCLSLGHNYSKGGWLQLNWKNGSRRIFDQADLYSKMRKNYLHRYSRYYGYFDTSESLPYHISVGTIPRVELDMDSIDCFAPVWNSGKWEKRTFKLSIRPSVLPTFDNPNDEIVLMNLNETSRTINCTVIERKDNEAPSTKMFWIKDGKKLTHRNGLNIKGSITTNGNVTKFSLRFFNVSHVMQGDYQCVAKNWKGKVVKTYRVLVRNEGSRISLLIITVTVLSLSALVGAMISLLWCHLRLRTKLGKIATR